MRKLVLTVLILTLTAGTSQADTPDLTFSDFIPIVQAPSDKRDELRTVKSPDAVTSETREVEVDGKKSQYLSLRGKTLQDSANTFLKKRGETGAARIEATDGSGGYIATGAGIYDRDMSNITAVRISQRLAYLQALMDAKVQLSQLINSINAEATEIYSHSNENQTTSENSTNDLSNTFDTAGKTSVAAVLKGYVTYDVYDDEQATVYVTIVATDKTMGKFSRPANDTLIADNFADGMNAILAEIQSGVVPPVGGRIVDVPSTGEIAFVGFGSAVVYPAQKTAAQAIQRRDALKIAGIRADSELCGILTGDNVDGQASYRESIRQSFGDYAEIENSDPMNELASSADIAQVKSIKDSFMSNSEFNETIITARKGILPPGITRRSWLDSDNTFAYAVSVYVPSFTNKAASDGKAMNDAELLKPVETDKPQNTPTASGNIDSRKPAEELKRGVTGTIQQNL